MVDSSLIYFNFWVFYIFKINIVLEKIYIFSFLFLFGDRIKCNNLI